MKRKNMTVSKKTTRRALGMNILSLLLCVSMLIGTTFAWFTDSVTSGRNQIIAGNLDVEVYHGQSTTIDKTDANKVTSATELFTVDRWEPGMVVYENIMIANVGDMALKYKMALREWAKNTVDNGEHDLSEVLTIKVIDGGFTPSGDTMDAQRASAKTAANAVEAAFDKETTGTLYPVGTTGEGKSSEKIYGIVIFWEPSDNDNTYNINNDKTVDSLAPDENGLLTLNRLYLEIGLDVIATQVEHESDSFDENYDQISALADLPERLNGSARSGGIRRISNDNNTQVTVTEEGNEISTTASDKVVIKIETTVQTDIQTETTKQTVVGAEVPAEAALKVMDDTFASGFTTKTDKQSQDDVLVLTMDVQTKEATESSVSVDVSLFADATRTLTTAATETTEEEKTVEQKTNVPVTELSKPVTVELQLDKNLKNVKVTHSHYNSTEKKTETKEFTSVASLSALDNQKFYYDASTGKLTLKTDKFSIVDITYDKPYVCQIGNTAAAVGYATLEEAIAAAKNGDVIYLTKDITTGAVAIPANKTITIDGNNKTVTLTDRALFNNSGLDDLTLDGIGANANLTVKNLTMVSNTKQFALITAVAPRDQGAATVVFDGCTFKNMYSAVYGNTMESDDSFALTIKNSKFENCTYGVSIEKDEKWTVAFTGNTMTGEEAIQELWGETSGYLYEPTFKVTDGSYSKNPSDFAAEGYVPQNKDGVYTLKFDPELAIYNSETTVDDTTFVKYMTLAAFRDSVNNGTTYDDMTVKQLKSIAVNEINEAGEFVTNNTWVSIGYGNNGGYAAVEPFKGTYDGNGFTISGVYHNCYDNNDIDAGSGGADSTAFGLFGCIQDATIKNLTVDHVFLGTEEGNMYGKNGVGGFVGVAIGNCNFTNLKLRNATICGYICCIGGIVGGVSQGNFVFDGMDVDVSNELTTWNWGNWSSCDTSMGGIVGTVDQQIGTGRTTSHVTIKNSTVAAKVMQMNDVMSNYAWYQYRCSGMLVGGFTFNHSDYIWNNPDNITDEQLAAALTCENVTVTYDMWNHQYYCTAGEHIEGKTYSGDHLGRRDGEEHYEGCNGDDCLVFDQLVGGWAGGTWKYEAGETYKALSGVTVNYLNDSKPTE